MDTQATHIVEKAIDSGLSWGVKSAFVSYVLALTDGIVELSEGSVADEGLSMFSWPLSARSDFDEVTGAGSIRLNGRVRFMGHGGALDVDIAQPRIDVRDYRGILSVEDGPGGESRDLVDFDFAEIPVVDGYRGWRGTFVRLLPSSAPTFGMAYSPGEIFDDLVIAIKRSGEWHGSRGN